MLRISIIFLLLLGTAAAADAKKPIDPYGELGFMFGYSYYIGDINPYNHFGPRKKTAFGGLYRLNLTQRHVIRLHAMRMNIEGYDADNDDLDLINRNLNFRNKMTEVALILEINFHPYTLGSFGTGITPYVFGGLAYFSMNPEAELDGEYVELIPLATEGQGASGGPSAYSKSQFAIPFGVGLKAGFTKRLAINFEWGIRRTYTDYLDDVGGVYADPDVVRDLSGDLGRELADRSIQPIGPEGINTGMARGNPENRDWYFYTGLTLTVRVGKNGTTCWGGTR